MAIESNTKNESSSSLVSVVKKLVSSVDNLIVSVDTSTDEYKRSGQSFGIAEGGIVASALNEIVAKSGDLYKKALDPKTDYSKGVNSQLKFHEGNAKVVLAALRESGFLAPEKKKEPITQAGAEAEALAKSPLEGTDPVANAAKLGGDETNGVIKENSEKRRILEDTELNDSAENEKKIWDKKLNYAATGAGAMANILQNLYVTTGSKNKAMFTAMKAFAIGETIVQTYRAAMGAYAAYASIPYVGPALGIAAAAAAIAAGMARVNAIKKTKPGGATGTINNKGSANPAYKGGSANAYPVPQRQEQAQPTQNITVIIHNPLSQQNWAEIAESEIIPAINDAVGNRNVHLTVETVD